jgi:hypothetical protein
MYLFKEFLNRETRMVLGKNKETGINGSGIDDNVLLFVLDKAIDCEAQYRDGIKERYEKARESVKKAIDDKELTSGKEEKEETKDRQETDEL